MRCRPRIRSAIILLLAFGLSGQAGLGQSQQAKKIDELIAQFGDRQSWQQAVDALARIGEPAVGPLVHTLRDESVAPWTIHARCVETLAKIGTPRAAKAVVECLEDRRANEYVRGFAALAVAELKPDGAVEVLARSLKDKSRMVRWKSAQALGRLADEGSAEALIETLSDEDQYVRAATARSLGEIGSARAAGGLVHAFADESWAVRRNARNALLEVGTPAVEPLIAALQDTSSQVRWQAAWALGKLNVAEVAEPLIKLLSDAGWMVRDQAAVALTRIKSQSALSRLREISRGTPGHAREQAAWILQERESTEANAPSGYPVSPAPKLGACGGTPDPLFPHMLDKPPAIPSPCPTEDGTEIVTAHTRNNKYTVVPVTVENGRTWDYRQVLWGKGRQLCVNAADFPTLARTGLHSDRELDRTKTITDRSIVLITELGRPGRSSGAGFMAHDEDILSVLKGDNRLVQRLGLTHPQMARPLFHIWNMVLKSREVRGSAGRWAEFDRMLYNGKTVSLTIEGTKGWQESLFEDEVLGMHQFEIARELDQHEKTFLRERYPDLTDDQITELVKKLSHLHTGEMVPYYIMRYGFYEGHTSYRADPIAIALIFGLRSLEEIEAAFPGKLHQALTGHFTREDMLSGS